MSTHSRASRRLAPVLAGSLGLAALATGVSMAPASAASTGLVISEVYGGGGNSGAVFTHDFIELSNPTSAAISVEGMSVQYRSASGTTAQVTQLSGSVPAGGHYLVQEAQGSGGTTALPTPDAVGTIAMSGTSGQVFLVSGTTAITTATVPASGNLAGSTGFVDMVGFGTAAAYETAATPSLSNTTSAARTSADADNNAAEFATGTPDPQNAATGGGGDPEPDPEPTDATIAEIQGTDTDTSPLVGDTVATEGVVTALYDTGGFNGYYLQTGGTGGAPADDATPGASDAVFVYVGSGGTYPDLGDSLEVTGEVSEYSGTTEINQDSFTELETALEAPTGYTGAWDTLDSESEKEAHEGELIDASGADFVVSDNYDANYYGQFTLAAGGTPLVQPTDVADAQDTAAVAAVAADNAARGILLDDGASTNFNSNANKGTPLPWLTLDNHVRTGAAVTFHQPVVLEYRYGAWALQPEEQVTGAGSDVATFEDTRTEAPEEVGGDIRLATFNVLNYFPTTGADYVAAGGTCSYYNDRDGAHITVNTCTNGGEDGPRGAADQANLERQQAKIVHAINSLGASIVSLEEIENSVKFGKDRDYAVSTLVDALNTAAGSQVWDYAPSPDPADLPALADQDVIRTAFIYKPAAVALVGASDVLVDEDAFGNAREPLAQGFKAVGAPDSDAFAVIVNHFKSKGSGVDDGTGQGNANPDRIAQAESLKTFAHDFTADLGGSGATFLTGDFNSYTQEDPLQVLYGAGYTNLESDTAGESTYVYDGLVGSLDHVLANDVALDMVTGVDIWNINSVESVAYEYSRYNYNATLLYDGSPFRASDHDPEVVGLDLTEDGPVLATSSTSLDVQPNQPKAGKGNLTFKVEVSSTGGQPTGTVTVTAGGQSVTGAVGNNGKVVLHLANPFATPGTYSVVATYSGDASTAGSSTTADLPVRG